MELQLHERPAPPIVYSTGLAIDNMTWWFWIKAGMGFTLGAGVISLSAVAVWWLFLVNVMLFFFRVPTHR